MRNKRRWSRSFVAHFDFLENRRLLASGTSSPLVIGQIKQFGDFVSSTANPGADGVADVQIPLNNPIVGDEITSASIIGTTTSGSQLHWSMGSNADGFLDAEVVRVTNLGPQHPYFPYYQDNGQTAVSNLYISPPPAGQTLSSLSITLNYQDGSIQTATDSNDAAFANLSATASVAGETVSPSLLVPVAGGSAQFVGQYNTAGSNPTHSAGDAHVSLLSLPGGDTFGNLVDVYLSDGIASPGGLGDAINTKGYETWSWASSGGMASNYDSPLAVQASSSGVADLTFSPTRNEIGTTMTLRYVVSDGSGMHSYFTQFTGGTTDLTLIGPTWNHNAPVIHVSPASGDNYVSYTDPITNQITTATLQSLLSNTTGEFDRIYLNAGTYPIDSPLLSAQTTDMNGNGVNPMAGTALTISRPIQLDGSPNAILSFTANSTAPPNQAQLETDYGDAISINSSHVTLSNFQIRFPNQVFFSSGLAIGVGATSGNPLTPQSVDDNFQDLNIQGPAPAAHFQLNAGSTQRQDSYSTTLNSSDSSTLDGLGNDGREAQTLIDCFNASGTIEGCTLRGGTTEFDGGPWTVTGNTYLGTMPTQDRYTSAYPLASYQNQIIPSNTKQIFKSKSPHDQLISGNTLSETQPAGTPANSPLGFAYRFLFYAVDNGSGYHNLIQGNTAIQGVGRRLGSDTNPGTVGNLPGETYDNTANFPEFVLNESYRVDYEGITLPIAANNAQVLSIPPPGVTFYRQPVQAGDVVAILTGPNAGQYDTITQVLDPSDFLMQSPLPTGNSYQISVCQGLVDGRYIGNSFNLSKTTSVGFRIQGNQFGAQLIGNTIIGDDTTVISGGGRYNFNLGITLESVYVDKQGNDDNTGYVYPFSVPTEYWTHCVVFGAVVDGNLIEGSGGGIAAFIDLYANSDIGRTYLSATITNNHFLGYSTSANPNETGLADFSSALTIGYLNQAAPSSASGERTKTYGFANLDSNGNIIPNSNPSSGYLPNTVPTEGNAIDSVVFEDPNAIHVTLAGNWFTPTAGGPASLNTTIVSAVVNSIPIVYDPNASVSALPTSSLFGVSKGGSSYDSGGNTDPVGQGAAQAFDGNINTKWLTFASSGYLVYQFANGAAYAVTEYALTAGGDTSTYPDRAPRNWLFQGSNDGVNWTTLDAQTNQADTVSNDTRVYSFVNAVEFKDYRLDVTANNYETPNDNGGNGVIQLDELQLFAGPPSSSLTNVARGGTAKDSGNPVNGQGPGLAFDGNPGSEWLNNGPSGDLVYQFANGASYVVTQYALTAGGDTSTYPDRAPRNWLFRGSNDGVNWTTLDAQTNQADTVSGDTRTYTIANATPYKYYQLDITSNNYNVAGDNNDNGFIQLAELQLFAAVPAPSTTTLLASVATVASGGMASDSGNGNAAGGQGAAQAFDGDIGTKWLAFGPSGSIQYQFANGASYAVTQYALTAGGDTSTYPDRAPRNWLFRGSNDGVNWITLDAQTNQADTVSNDTRVYSFANATAYKDYELDVTANNYSVANDNNGNGLIQLAELQLFVARSLPHSIAASGTASDSGQGNGPNGQVPALAFDLNIFSTWLITATSNIYLQYQFGGGAAYAVTQYAMTAGGDTGTYTGRAPRNWTFSGSNDATTWVTLDSETNQADTISRDTRIYSLANGTAFLYYRLAISANNGDSTYTQLAELQLFAENGPVYDVAAGGMASDSGQGNGLYGQVPAKAFDGVFSTSWLLTANNGYLQYQFANGAAYAVTQYAMTAGGDTGTYTGRAPRNWTFSGSNDAMIWVPLDTEVGQADTISGDTRTYTIANSTAYKYYRLAIAANNGDSTYTQLAELQLFA